MKIKIPQFILNWHKRRKIKQKFGAEVRIDTLKVDLSANLGKRVYLACDADIRGGVTIGDYTYCNSRTILFKGAKIGRFCSIGYNVQIGCPEHPLNFFSTSPSIYRDSYMKKYCKWPTDDCVQNTVIKNDVWIGSNAIILQGVTVEDGAVIAAGAVVTKDVSPYTIVGGVPAKEIGKRQPEIFSKDSFRDKWWEWDMERIRLYADQLYGDIESNNCFKSKEEQMKR